MKAARAILLPRELWVKRMMPGSTSGHAKHLQKLHIGISGQRLKPFIHVLNKKKFTLLGSLCAKEFYFIHVNRFEIKLDLSGVS